MGLTNRQRLFVEHYLATWNASESARKAGYKGKSNSVGPMLMAKDSIKELIQQRMKETAMDADEVLMRLADIARLDIKDFMNDKGEADWEKVKAKGVMVKGLTPTRYGTRLELHDALRALELIGKAHALFTDRLDVTGKVQVIWDVPELLPKP